MPLRWVLFDLNGTLVDPGALAEPLGGSAGDEALVHDALDEANWQAMVLTLAGRRAAFADLLASGLRRRLELAGRDTALAEDALALLGTMPAYGDATAALDRLRGAGLRLGVLTQSSADAAGAVLRSSGLRDRMDVVLSAPDSGAFKPDARPYRMALGRIGAGADEVAFVAAHWWDVTGAKAVGMRTGW